MLQALNIQKSYGTNTVLSIPSFELQKGVYWIQGVNGSGKTTFLKMIAGLLSFEGDILVNDISLKHKPVLYRRQIGWSEAEPLFPPFMTGKNIIDLYCEIRKSPESEAALLIDTFQMKEYIENPIGSYSAGMTKKLSLLLSFIGSPSLLILDEPLITLDAKTVDTVCKLIKSTHQKGTSFLLSSHQDIDTPLLTYDAVFIVKNKTIALK